MDDILVFDAAAVRLHRQRAVTLLGGVADVLADLAARLLDRLDDTTHRFTQALDIGGRGSVAASLRARGMHVVSLDQASGLARLGSGTAVAGDPEFLPFAPGRAPQIERPVVDIPSTAKGFRQRGFLRPGWIKAVLKTAHHLSRLCDRTAVFTRFKRMLSVPVQNRKGSCPRRAILLSSPCLKAGVSRKV